MDGCTVRNNVAVGGRGFENYKAGGDGYGGGVYIAGKATITNCTITGNTARGGPAGNNGGDSGQGLGGGIHVGFTVLNGTPVYSDLAVDLATLNHTKQNKATTDGSDTYSPYRMI
jgi:hypothetical protein